MYTRESWGASEETLKSAKTSWLSQNKKRNQLTNESINQSIYYLKCKITMVHVLNTLYNKIKEEMGWLLFNWGRPPLCSSCLEACHLESSRCLYDKEQRERERESICTTYSHVSERAEHSGQHHINMSEEHFWHSGCCHAANTVIDF